MTIIACSIFRSELDHIIKQLGYTDLDVKYLNSMLHMYPKKLRVEMDREIEKRKDQDLGILFGECHNYMDIYENRDTIKKIPGRNCIEIILGYREYRRLSKDGAFFLMPEWTKRWREIFTKELDLTSSTARDFMQDMHSYLLYIDTGFLDIPLDGLKEISKYTGLEYKIYKADLKNLKKELERVIDGYRK